MEYTVSQLAKLSGVSARTLRYYDEIDLLKPKRINSSGYRIYGGAEVDKLQQILFYRELELSLEDIKEILHFKQFDVQDALESHLRHLMNQRNRLDRLITTVEQSIQAKEGGRPMSDQAKFDAFKKETIAKNEEQFGQEIREQYGEETIRQANQKAANLSKEEWQAHEALTKELNDKLAEATKQGDPTSALAQEVAALHKKWLIVAWPEGLYDEEKHYNLSRMYVEDPRFKAYYEAVEAGSAEFLHETLKEYLGRNKR